MGPEREPVTTLSTPSEGPPRPRARARRRAVSGVADAGFSTTVHPAASAGAIFRVTIVAGKFQGVTAATTPSGWRRTHRRFSREGEGTRSP